MRTRTMLVGGTVAALLGLVLTGVQAPAQEGPAVKQTAPTTVVKRLGRSVDPIQKLQHDVETLQKELAAQKAETARLQQKLDQSFSGPNGYSTTLITKTNWNRLPDNTLLRVWLRD